MTWSWLRVFTSAIIARLGHRGGQEGEPDVILSEKSAAHRGSAMEGMRTITACFARVPRRCMSRPYMHFLLMFHRFGKSAKLATSYMEDEVAGGGRRIQCPVTQRAKPYLPPQQLVN